MSINNMFVENVEIRFYSPQAGRAFTFLLDEKSKQKNQAKIITRLYSQMATGPAAILAGHRAVLIKQSKSIVVSNSIFTMVVEK